MDKKGLLFLYCLIFSGPILGFIFYLITNNLTGSGLACIFGPFIVWVAFLTYDMIHE